MIDKVHHINFLVADFSAATQSFNTLFQQEPEVETLIQREAMTGRYNVGGVNIVIVSPTSPTGTVGRYLQERGEGVFLVSFGVSSLDEFWQDYEQQSTIDAASPVRAGAADWQVQDIQIGYDFGVVLQLCESQSTDKLAR